MRMLSRRGFFTLVASLGGAATVAGLSSTTPAGAVVKKAVPTLAPVGRGWSPFEIMHEALSYELDAETFDAWLSALEFESYNGAVLTVSVPGRFMKKWIADRYADELLKTARAGFPSVARVDVVARPFGSTRRRPRLGMTPEDV